MLSCNVANYNTFKSPQILRIGHVKQCTPWAISSIPPMWKNQNYCRSTIIYASEVFCDLFGGLSKHDVDAARTTSQNVTSCFCNPFSLIQSHYACKMYSNYPRNWNRRFRDKKTKLNICHQMLTSSTQLQNRSFHNMERITSMKHPKVKNALTKRAKLLSFTFK